MATVDNRLPTEGTQTDIRIALETIASNLGNSDGHTIQNDSGTDMQQRDHLQFKGVYVEDNQTDDVTKVDIVRTMTKAQIDLLRGEEAKGFLIASDEDNDLPFTSDLVEYRNGDSVTEALDEIFDTLVAKELAKIIFPAGTYSMSGILTVNSANKTSMILYLPFLTSLATITVSEYRPSGQTAVYDNNPSVSREGNSVLVQTSSSSFVSFAGKEGRVTFTVSYS